VTLRRIAPRTLPVLAAVAVLGAGSVACATAAPSAAPASHDFRPGPGVTRTSMLSNWLPALAGTPGDTPVFVLEGKAPGGTLVVVAGTHENEIAGVVAATALVETARVSRGRVVVVPRANNSAVTVRDDERPVPEWITVGTPSGPRRFRFGARLTNPLHQGAPDPVEVRAPGAAEALPGKEARNLDRAYPGSADGPLTQRVAFAIVQLLRRERADLAFDLHEASPDSRLSWMIVAHPRALDVAASAVLDLDAAGLPMKLEVSDEGFRGLSHREWGDATDALAFLVETPNPNQAKGAIAVDPVDDPRYPLASRVAAHLRTILAVVAAWSAGAPVERGIELSVGPGPGSPGAKGLAELLHP
jgi:predicted deacylase